jgi:acyl dehydratase
MSYTIGQEWSATRTLTMPDLQAFARAVVSATGYGTVGGGYHEDVAVAKDKGWRTAVAWGLHSNALLAELLVDTFGRAFSDEGEFSARFLAPVYEGDVVRSVVTLAKVNRCPDGRVRLLLNGVCERAGGVRVVEGWAVVPVVP